MAKPTSSYFGYALEIISMSNDTPRSVGLMFLTQFSFFRGRFV